MSRSATGSLRRIAFRAALLAVAALLTSGTAYAAGPEATLEPSEIALGEAAALTVTLDGEADAPRIPAVDGLSIEPQGRSMQIQIVNGRVSRQTSFVYAVRPQRAGAFTLPAIEAAGGSGDPLSTGPLVLRVVPSRAAALPGTPSDAASPGGRAETRLELRLPEGGLFVGQLEPVEIRLLVPQGVTLTELAAPVLTGPGFTLSPLADEQPEESEEEIDGIRTLVLTWKAAVSAVKPGPQPLAARIEGAARVREPAHARRGARSGLLDDGFFGGGSLFDSFFGGRPLALRLETPPLEVAVTPLPEAGRPADFTGAVGEFSIVAHTDASRATAGDPVTLVLDVAGRGNFDRVSVPGFESSGAFKSYPPSARFEGLDATGFEGRKRFTQSIVPQQPGALSVPPQRFSYFDPHERRYVTRETEALALAVVPPAGGLAAAEPPVATPEQADAPATGPLPFRADVGTLRAPAPPRFLSPVFLAALEAPLALFAVAGFVAWRRRRGRDPERAARRATDRAVRESVARLEEACRRADAEAFFTSARRALQARLGQRLAMRPEAVTLADVEARLSADPRLTASVRRVLEEADAFSYAGGRMDAGSLDTARRHVRETLALLEVHG